MREKETEREWEGEKENAKKKGEVFCVCSLVGSEMIVRLITRERCLTCLEQAHLHAHIHFLSLPLSLFLAGTSAISPP